MPILEPKEGQSEQEYIEQCILDLENKGEGQNNEQRYAICKSKWEENMSTQELPLFKMVINNADEDETGVDMVSLVDTPAMGYSYQLFSEQKKRQQFNIENEEKRLVSGVLMLAGTPIYRNNPAMGEHYIIFEKDTIRNIMQKFFKKNYHLQANFNHNESTRVDDVYFYESFQIDEDRGISSPRGYDLPDGTWFGTMKVEDDEIWQEIKNGSFRGFSVEGIFEYQNLTEEEQMLRDIDNLLNLLGDF